MANKYESEITDGTEAQEILNPLDEAVNEKVYTNASISANKEDLVKPIEEPRFTPPPIKKQTISVNQESKQEEREPVNPELKSLPKKEADMAASQMVTLALSTYEMLNNYAKKFVQISEKKQNQLVADGEINLSAMIDYDYGKQVTTREFFSEFNKSTENLFEVTPEFKDNVRPPLERIFKKKGIGATDEQTVLFLFLQDLSVKIMQGWQIKQTAKQIIEVAKDANYRNLQYNQQQYTQQQPQPQPKQRNQEPPIEEKDVEDDFDFEEDLSPVEPEEKEYRNELPQKRRGRPKKD
jgi:hypothetical protein